MRFAPMLDCRQRMLPVTALIGLMTAMLLGGSARAGDGLEVVLLGQSLVKHDPREDHAALEGLSPLLEDADVVFTNLEISVCEPGRCQPTRDDTYFHGTEPEILDFVQSIGVNLVSLANNHAWDYGTEGVRAMLEATDARELVHAGTGLDLSAATSPAYLRVGGQRVALIAIASARLKPDAVATESRPGVNIMLPGDEAAWERNLAAIRLARSQADLVIAYQHFQTIGTPEWQRRWARAAVDNGADLYVSHGAPTLGGIETRGRGIIFYGLGNFIFHSRTGIGEYTGDVWESVIARLRLAADRSIQVELVPVVIDEGTPGEGFLETRGFPSLAPAARAASILQRLDSMSRPLGTRLEVRAGRGYLRTGGE